ncbi:hypothetical protein PV326_003645 [Microctonus aethiopoides]|nr:hypothetical protein PV326_003645 [Microctonus aethiopoides]
MERAERQARDTRNVVSSCMAPVYRVAQKGPLSADISMSVVSLGLSAILYRKSYGPMWRIIWWTQLDGSGCLDIVYPDVERKTSNISQERPAVFWKLFYPEVRTYHNGKFRPYFLTKFSFNFLKAQW